METVSLITPCFNGEKYLEEFFGGLVNQTYSDLEVIFVDDGSTDNTREICERYIPILEAKGYKFIYVHKENGGQASAINEGLKLFSGQYLIWPDSDDIMMPDNISKKVQYLQEHPEKNMVFCSGVMVNDDNLDCPRKVMRRKKPKGKDNIFEDYIYERNVVFAPVSMMVRTSAFLRCIPERQIYPGRQGQNWQIILPLVYSGEWGYIDECLFKYVVHMDSHSHENRTYEKTLERLEGFQDILLNTIYGISEMPDFEKKGWEKVIRTKYMRKRMYLEYHMHNKNEVRKIRYELYNLNQKKNIRETELFCWIRNLIYGDRV